LEVEDSRLAAFLKRHRRMGLDTCVFIYQIEENLNYVHLTNQIFEWLRKPRAEGVTSNLTMLEVLVQPYRDADEERVDSFYALLSTYPHLRWIDVTLSIADRAAHLRSEYALQTPDAIQAATALSENATGFISNDRSFQKVSGLDVVILDDLLETTDES